MVNKKSNIAVLTSGGDCQGMNSVLYGLTLKHLQSIKMNNDHCESIELYLIYNGYQGLIDGHRGRTIVKSDTKLLEKYLYTGGTIINSSRCREFYHQRGRRKAAHNLMRLNIENLLVIGGDGSLTGANLLRIEWPQYVQDYLAGNHSNSQITSQITKDSRLNLIGIIGSIDNDFYGTEMTIGTDSALTRIVECIDALQTTAKSHSRAMVVEVMGRNCGYLAISSALCTQATYVFIPESPLSSMNEWKVKLKKCIEYERKNGQYHHIILIAEGACEINGLPIRSQQIKDYLSKECSIETRLIILGHLQRGGHTSAFDHLLAIGMGSYAFDLFDQMLSINDNQSNNEPLIITFNNDRINHRKLSDCIDGIAEFNALIKEHQWTKVMEHRGKNFLNTWENYRQLKLITESSLNINPSSVNWAVIIISNDHQLMPGVNGILYALVRYAHPKMIKVYGYHRGVKGLIDNRFIWLKWLDVLDITSMSGSLLLSIQNDSKTVLNTESVGRIVENLQKNSIKSICFIGDQLAREYMNQLTAFGNEYEYLKQMKFALVPVKSITNNQIVNTEIAWSNLGHDSIRNKTIQLLYDLINCCRGIENQLYLIRINFDILISTNGSFIDHRSFAVAINGVDSIIHSNDDESIAATADKICRSMQDTNENKFILIDSNDQWPRIQSIYSNLIGKYQNSIHKNSIDLTLAQIPSSISPFDRKLSIKLGMECGKYFCNDTITINSLIINTPFMNMGSNE